MIKKLFAASFFTLLFFSFSFAQNPKITTESNWEFLEISAIKYCGNNYFQIQRSCRSYTFLTSNAGFEAQSSLEWMQDSNWELVSVFAYEGGSSLFFKRIYNQQRTAKEIERLKKEFEKDSSVSPANGLIDLDLVEYNQKAKELAQSEKTRYENLLKQIKELPIKIISVETTFYDPKFSNVAAEIVLDATNLLVKDSKSYRSSEAENYYQATTKQILESLNAQPNGSFNGNSWDFSRATRKPEKIGGFKNFYSKVNLKISVIVTINGQQNIVSQGFIYADLKKDNE